MEKTNSKKVFTKKDGKCRTPEGLVQYTLRWVHIFSFLKKTVW